MGTKVPFGLYPASEEARKLKESVDRIEGAMDCGSDRRGHGLWIGHSTKQKFLFCVVHIVCRVRKIRTKI